jgi:predicted naringenin-chalcone synthase
MVICCLKATELSPIDVLLALICDAVVGASGKTYLDVSSSTSQDITKMVMMHWRTFTGERIDDTTWALNALAKGYHGIAGMEFSDILPHFWMAFRNVGMAKLPGPDDAGHPQLNNVFTMYFGSKIATIWAAWDHMGGIKGDMSQDAIDMAAAHSIKVKVDGTTAQVQLTSDIICMKADRLFESFKVVKGAEQIQVTLLDGVTPFALGFIPPNMRSHYDIYKWHRRWEQVLVNLGAVDLTCVVVGENLCAPLVELIFASHTAEWRSTAKRLTWPRAGAATYVPGPAAMQGSLKRLAIAPLRKLLLLGMSVEEATDMGLLCDPAKIGIRPQFSPPVRSQGQWKWGGDQLGLPEISEAPRAEKGSCSLLGYGLTTPGEEHKCTQAEIAKMLGASPQDPRDWPILTSSHIQTRYLAELAEDLASPEKVDMKRLHEKHMSWGTKMLREAITKACADASISPTQLGHITVATSTGYLLPGFTAHIMQDRSLGIPLNAQRQDIVGMGCHAGLNSLKSAAAWAVAHPGKYAIACGVEVCSAQYVWGNVTRKDLNHVIVNSLFGDGCFCCVLRASEKSEVDKPAAYFDVPPAWWMQLTDVDALDDMVYKVERSETKYCFLLSELAPYHVGGGLFSLMHQAIYAGIPVHYAQHVVTHTGGKTVLECSAVGLGLNGSPQDTLPYTIEALKDFGNQSSTSILFAFHNLVKSGNVVAGDLGMLVTMGPGAGLEMAMWTAGSRFSVSEPNPSTCARRAPSSSSSEAEPEPQACTQGDSSADIPRASEQAPPGGFLPGERI